MTGQRLMMRLIATLLHDLGDAYYLTVRMMNLSKYVIY